MEYNLVFYGSLMDSTQTKTVCGFHPIQTETGFFHGTLFEVNDCTEPNNICRYPLAVLGNVSSLIVAKLKVFALSEDETRMMQARLMEFEGPLYEPKLIEFLGSSDVSKYGCAFVAKPEVDVVNDPRIKPMSSVLDVYSWE